MNRGALSSDHIAPNLPAWRPMHTTTDLTHLLNEVSARRVGKDSTGLGGHKQEEGRSLSRGLPERRGKRER